MIAKRGFKVAIAVVLVVAGLLALQFFIRAGQVAVAQPVNQLQAAREYRMNERYGEAPEAHLFDVTFTKWITGATSMVGVGGGAIGPATFTGEIQFHCVVGTTECVEALYYFKGSKHSFGAHIWAKQDDVAGTGVIVGVITDGWLKGGSLTGEYQVLAKCNMETPGNVMDPPTLCFQGVLHLQRAP